MGNKIAKSIRRKKITTIHLNPQELNIKQRNTIFKQRTRQVINTIDRVTTTIVIVIKPKKTVARKVNFGD